MTTISRSTAAPNGAVRAGVIAAALAVAACFAAAIGFSGTASAADQPVAASR
ncbi:MAG: hypothetical protein ACTHKM_11225 [Tsuneonella sp.]